MGVRLNMIGPRVVGGFESVLQQQRSSPRTALDHGDDSRHAA
jgi:hypothetical protein